MQEVVPNFSNHLKINYDGQYELCKKVPNPFALEYDPQFDITPLCSPEEASYFQSIIGIMRWMVELGRIDIAVEVSKLSSFVAMP